MKYVCRLNLIIAHAFSVCHSLSHGCNLCCIFIYNFTIKFTTTNYIEYKIYFFIFNKSFTATVFNLKVVFVKYKIMGVVPLSGTCVQFKSL